MDLWTLIVAYALIFHNKICKGLPISPRTPVDELIQMQLLRFNQGSSLADGLVLAGTIVEGGPVFGRSRKILGGQSAHPGLEYLKVGIRIQKCPPITFGYECLDWVAPQCEVIRHLLVENNLCTCKVDAC